MWTCCCWAGTLTIRYTGDTVLMTGNAVEVFTGTVEV